LKIEEDVLPAKSVRGDGNAFEHIHSPKIPLIYRDQTEQADENRPVDYTFSSGEFDPGSERTLAACLTHASRTRKFLRG
jgi:hypothetical protein